MKPLHFALAVVVSFAAISNGFTQSSRVATQQVDDVEVQIDDGGIQLKAPHTCEIGELVRFDARSSNVDSLVWDILPASDDFETVDDSRRAFFSARSGGEYLILIAGAKNGKAFLVHQRLTVKGLPVPLTGLSAKVGNWLKLLPDIPDRDMKLLSMATVFEKLAEQPVEPDNMIEATALANSAVLGDDVQQWIPFLDKLGAELDKLIDADKLETTEQFQAVWKEIASALKRHARK